MMLKKPDAQQIRCALVPCLIAAFLLFPLSIRAQEEEQLQIDVADGFFSRGFFEESADEYRVYLDQFPQGQHTAVALFRMAESEIALKNYDAASKSLDRLLALQLEDDMGQRALLRKGVVLIQRKQFDEAIKILDPLTSKLPKGSLRAETTYHLGKAYFEGGKPDEAMATYRKLATDPDAGAFAPYGRYQLAYIYLAQDEIESAAIEFSDIAASPEADEALRMESRFRAAEAYDKIGWFEAAVKAYQHLQSEFPNSQYARRAENGYTWALYHAGMYPEAFVSAQNLIKNDPETPHKPGLLYLQANCLQQQKQYEQAVALYESIRESFPTSEFAVRGQYKTGWALYFDGKLPEARREMESFLQLEERYNLEGDASFLLGTIFAEVGNYSDAYEEFRLVAAKYPDSEFAPEAQYKSGECLVQMGRSEEAGKAFEAFARTFPTNDLAGEALLRSGDADFQAGRFPAAAGKYGRVAADTPKGAVQEEALYRLAVAHHNAKDYKSSVAVFTNLSKEYPKGANIAEAKLRIGDYLLREGKQPMESVAFFEAAHNLDPSGPHAGDALKGLALARFETNDLNGAADSFLKIIDEWPAVKLNEETYAWVGQHLFDEKKWAAAIKAFEAMLARSPEYPNPERVLFKIAEAREHGGDAKAALKEYAAVLDAAPRSAVALEAKYRMAKLYETEKKVDEAINLYLAAANANSGDTAARARFRLGEIYEDRGDFAEASRSFMRVAILFLHEELSPESLWRAGQCFEKNGDMPQARKAYREILDDYPDSAQVGKARARLEGGSGE